MYLGAFDPYFDFAYYSKTRFYPDDLFLIAANVTSGGLSASSQPLELAFSFTAATGVSQMKFGVMFVSNSTYIAIYPKNGAVYPWSFWENFAVYDFTLKIARSDVLASNQPYSDKLCGCLLTSFEHLVYGSEKPRFEDISPINDPLSYNKFCARASHGLASGILNSTSSKTSTTGQACYSACRADIRCQDYSFSEDVGNGYPMCLLFQANDNNVYESVAGLRRDVYLDASALKYPNISSYIVSDNHNVYISENLTWSSKSLPDYAPYELLNVTHVQNPILGVAAIEVREKKMTF